jgi:mono/diheme cytochrome c family protein
MMKPLLLLASFAALACAQSPTGDAKHGKELFVTYACYSCHSFDGHGGAGARLVPMPLNQAGFIGFVRNAGRMPSYGAKVISDAQLVEIYAYIKTLPTSPDAKNIPLIQELLKEN